MLCGCGGEDASRVAGVVFDPGLCNAPRSEIRPSAYQARSLGPIRSFTVTLSSTPLASHSNAGNVEPYSSRCINAREAPEILVGSGDLRRSSSPFPYPSPEEGGGVSRVMHAPLVDQHRYGRFVNCETRIEYSRSLLVRYLGEVFYRSCSSYRHLSLQRLFSPQGAPIPPMDPV